MADLQPSLGIVRAMLATIAKTVGCSVDCFQVQVQLGEWVYLDVYDQDFEGEIDRAVLTPALIESLASSTQRPVLDAGACTPEGGTLTVQIEWEQSGDIVLRVGF